MPRCQWRLDLVAAVRHVHHRRRLRIVGQRGKRLEEPLAIVPLPATHSILPRGASRQNPSRWGKAAERPCVGSSRSSSLGRLTRARQSNTSFCWPCERWKKVWLTRPAYRTCHGHVLDMSRKVSLTRPSGGAYSGPKPRRRLGHTSASCRAGGRACLPGGGGRGGGGGGGGGGGAAAWWRVRDQVLQAEPLDQPPGFLLVGGCNGAAPQPHRVEEAGEDNLRGEGGGGPSLSSPAAAANAAAATQQRGGQRARASQLVTPPPEAAFRLMDGSA